MIVHLFCTGRQSSGQLLGFDRRSLLLPVHMELYSFYYCNILLNQSTDNLHLVNAWSWGQLVDHGTIHRWAFARLHKHTLREDSVQYCWVGYCRSAEYQIDITMYGGGCSHRFSQLTWIIPTSGSSATLSVLLSTLISSCSVQWDSPDHQLCSYQYAVINV